MKNIRSWVIFFAEIILGCAVYALGFALFLEPNGTNCGGLSGLAMIAVRLTGMGTVGLWTLIANVPLFIAGGKRIGSKFFIGSLVGAVAMSGFIDLFEHLPKFETEIFLGSLYGGVLCGAGIGLVFLSGASSGGSDIIVRLLKLRWRNVPVGKISLGFDLCVALLTGAAFHSMASILYCGVVLFVSSYVMDAVIYRFDYSKVALIISSEYEAIAHDIWDKLERGVTYLYGQGSYSGIDTKVLLVAVKRRQLAELQELVVSIDPNAFIIIQESHQVLGDGFLRYSKNLL